MKPAIKEACMASLRAARINAQSPDDYKPATQAAYILERMSATEALEIARDADRALADPRLDHFVTWIGLARENARTVLRHLQAIVQEEAEHIALVERDETEQREEEHEPA